MCAGAAIGLEKAVITAAVSDHAAGYLLLHFPELTEQARHLADDALHGNRGRDLSQPQRRSEGQVSDSTMKRGLQLAEALTLSDHLARVRQWIDTEMPPGDRELLLTTWRTHQYGEWKLVAKELGRDLTECLDWWNAMISDLAQWLNQSAGAASG